MLKKEILLFLFLCLFELFIEFKLSFSSLKVEEGDGLLLYSFKFIEDELYFLFNLSL